MQRKFQQSYHFIGALAANLSIYFTSPSPCSLAHVSFVGSNASDATLDIGTSADTDGFLDGGAIGDSNTPAEYDRDDFNGALLTDAGKELPRISDGTVVVCVIDYDGASGTAAEDVTLVLTFIEG